MNAMNDTFLRVSAHTPSYFEDADGRPFVPVGLNLAFVRGAENMGEDEVFAAYERWMKKLATNGGNFARVWLGVPFFDVMPARVGEYDATRLRRILTLIDMAERFGIRLKLTLEHFRRIEADAQSGDSELFPGAVNFTNGVYKPLCADMAAFLTSPAGRAAFLDKARFLAANGVGDSATVVMLEPWNEFDSVAAPAAAKIAWDAHVRPRLQALFPRQIVTQNLGSFSAPISYKAYDWLAALDGNCVMQAHRYLDPGAALDVCRGPVDVLSADAIRELKQRRPDVPALLAEGGAVEAHHASYSKLYAADAEGTILHDVIFAPFFAGAAGCGQPWHWDHLYVEQHDLYRHFAAFAHAIAGLDPVAEKFTPFYTETPRGRVYGLRGACTDVMWVRDKASDWQRELVDGQCAALLENERVPVSESAEACTFYDPWDAREGILQSDNGWATLPPFRRSMVINVTKQTKGKTHNG